MLFWCCDSVLVLCDAMHGLRHVHADVPLELLDAVEVVAPLRNLELVILRLRV
jgi:hypothetical protein